MRFATALRDVFRGGRRKSVATAAAAFKTGLRWLDGCRPPRLVLNLLHRYLFREVLFATVVAVLLFVLVMLGGVTIKDLVGRTASGQVPLTYTLEMMLRVTPSLATYSLPAGLLTAVLLVLGRLSAQHEITAMRSAGIGLLRLGAPILVIAVVGVAVSCVINYEYAPRQKTRYREMLFEVGQTNPESLIVPGTFIREFPNIVAHVGAKVGDELRDVWIWELDGEHRVERFTWLERARVRVDDAANQLVVTAEGAVHTDIRNEGNPLDFSRVPYFPTIEGDGYERRFDIGEVFKRRVFERKVSWMTFTELVQERRRLLNSTAPEDVARLHDVRMNLHEKGALAFSVLSFALVAVPLGIQTSRKETSANLGIALGMMLVYYFGLTAVSWLGRRPELHPELLLWVPNFAFQITGAWMWWQLGRN